MTARWISVKLFSQLRSIAIPPRCAIHTSFALSCDADKNSLAVGEAVQGDNTTLKRKGLKRPDHSWEISVKYLSSKTYQEVYKGQPIWRPYRRNFAGTPIYEPRTRQSCLELSGKFKTNHPCPVCRDEYLVLDYRNVNLLTQFLIPGTGDVMDSKRCGLCQKQYQKLLAEILKAKDYGYLTFEVPFRTYDYRHFYPWWTEAPVEQQTEAERKLESKRPRPQIVYPIHNPEKRNLFDFFTQSELKSSKY